MSSARDVKKLAFTCEQCRKRKVSEWRWAMRRRKPGRRGAGRTRTDTDLCSEQVKCDGEEPSCGRCKARKEVCEYKQYVHQPHVEFCLRCRRSPIEPFVPLCILRRSTDPPPSFTLTALRSASRSSSPRCPSCGMAGSLPRARIQGHLRANCAMTAHRRRGLRGSMA